MENNVKLRVRSDFLDDKISLSKLILFKLYHQDLHDTIHFLCRWFENYHRCSFLPSQASKEILDKTNSPPLIEAIKTSFLPLIMSILLSRNLLAYHIYQLGR